jgi:hypothetical protein
MFVEPRHDLDEVAGAVPVIELEGRISSHASLQAPGTAGQGEQVGAPATPPVARDCTADVPIFCMETMVKTVPKASISFS